MKSYLESQIAERRQALLDLDRQSVELDRRRLVVEAEMRSYENALDHLRSETQGSAQTQDKAKDAPPQPDVGASNGSRDGQRSTLLPHWREVFREMAQAYPKPLSNDQVFKGMTKRGHSVRRESLRTQLWGYKNRGLMESVGHGFYRITKAGAEAAGIALPSVDKTNAAPKSTTAGTVDLLRH